VPSNNLKKDILEIFIFLIHFLKKKLEQILNIIYLVKLLKNDAQIFNSFRNVYEEDGRAIKKLAQDEFRGSFAV
jgi:hypothetical protein